MKVLRPAVTCILTSHMKPGFLDEAIGSAVGQSRTDIAIIVADSGQWIGSSIGPNYQMAQLHEKWQRHPLVEWVSTGEPPDLKFRKCPVAWSANEVIRAGLVRGRYMCTFYDDDRYLPRFMEAMAGYLDARPDCKAVWCSQHRLALERDGTVRTIHMSVADHSLLPGQLDCFVDGGQVMWRTSLLDDIGDPWLPEDPDESVCCHSDGIFLERIAKAAGVVEHVQELLCENRKTPVSTYAPT